MASRPAPQADGPAIGRPVICPPSSSRRAGSPYEPQTVPASLLRSLARRASHEWQCTPVEGRHSSPNRVFPLGDLPPSERARGRIASPRGRANPSNALSLSRGSNPNASARCSPCYAAMFVPKRKRPPSALPWVAFLGVQFFRGLCDNACMLRSAESRLRTEKLEGWVPPRLWSSSVVGVVVPRRRCGACAPLRVAALCGEGRY